MKRWLQEPLLHFFLAGGLLFAAYAWFDRDGDAPRVVRVTAAEVDWLKETWMRQWQRPPSEAELRSLVNDYLKENLLAREAQELGLGENDTVIRRRLAQKMEFLVQDTTANLTEPDETELRRFYAANSTHYQTPARVSFTQIYFRSEVGAKQAWENLKTNSAAASGDRILLERDYTGVDEQTVTALFGPEFAAKIFALESGRWHGPIASGYGFHWVMIDERQAAQPRSFEAVREQLREAWQRSQLAKANEQFFAGLLRKYDVIVEDAVKLDIGAQSEAQR